MMNAPPVGAGTDSGTTPRLIADGTVFNAAIPPKAHRRRHMPRRRSFTGRATRSEERPATWNTLIRQPTVATL